MPASVYKQLYYKDSLFRSVQANHKMYNLTGINVIDSCVICQHACNKSAQASNFHALDIEGSEILSCTDTLVLEMKLASDTKWTTRYHRMLRFSSAKLIYQMSLLSAR